MSLVSMLFRNAAVQAAVAFGVLLASPLAGAPLSGSSGVFTLPGATGPLSSAPGVLPALASSGPNHTGTWGAPADPQWWGTYNGTGPGTASADSGNIVLDFTALDVTYLPNDTYIRLSDLDSNEVLTLTGYDTAGNVLMSHWLSDAVFVGGGNPADFVQGFMPSWAFDSLTGVYTLTGESAAGNPTVLYVIQTTANLSRIDLGKDLSYGVSLSSGTSDVPEPASAALAGIGLLAAGLLRLRMK